jgi:hypothetical protein
MAWPTNEVENAIAQGDRWAWANATFTQRQGINVYRKDGSMEWWVRSEAPYEPIAYKLHHTYQTA